MVPHIRRHGGCRTGKTLAEHAASSSVAQGRVERTCRFFGTEIYRGASCLLRTSFKFVDQSGSNASPTQLRHDGEGLEFDCRVGLAVAQSGATDMTIAVDRNEHQLAIRREVLEQAIQPEVPLGID